jgi:hypothetical protein
MLASISSRELSDWMLYETVTGPVDTTYERTALRHLIDAMVGSESQRYPDAPTWWALVRNRGGGDDGDDNLSGLLDL